MVKKAIFPPATESDATWKAPAPLRYFSWFTTLFVLCLIFLGGQVKSHEAGLSVPDWPLTYGQNPITYPISDWTGGIFHEHLHRLVAGTAAMLTLTLCLWMFLVVSPRWLRWLSAAAVVTVLLQALLGGLTVWYQLPVWISSSHATLAQTYLLMNVIMAYSLSIEYSQRRAQRGTLTSDRAAFQRVLVLIGLIYVQLLLGAVMRHTESGLAIPDFPKTAGSWVPSFSEERLAWVNDWRFEKSVETGTDLPPVVAGQMHIHFAHRVGAVVVTAYLLWLAAWLYKRRDQYPYAARTVPWLCLLVLVQFSLGATVIWTSRIPLITSFHVVTGAALLALSTLVALRAYPGRKAVQEAVGIARDASASKRAIA